MFLPRDEFTPKWTGTPTPAEWGLKAELREQLKEAGVLQVLGNSDAMCSVVEGPEAKIKARLDRAIPSTSCTIRAIDEALGESSHGASCGRARGKLS